MDKFSGTVADDKGIVLTFNSRNPNNSLSENKMDIIRIIAFIINRYQRYICLLSPILMTSRINVKRNDR